MSLEKLKIKAELLRVQAAKAEMEMHVEERKLEIERLLENVSNQDKRINELQDKLKE